LLSIGDLSALNNEAGWVEGAWQFWLDPRLGCQMRSGLLDFTSPGIVAGARSQIRRDRTRSAQRLLPPLTCLLSKS